MNYYSNSNIHFIGIKGSGMCALALLLHKLGNTISGSDIADTFYTDALLIEANISYNENFSAENVQKPLDLVIYSAAYAPENNEELEAALTQYTCLSYPQALGKLSEEFLSCAVIGTHGKTSTTALAGSILKALQAPVMTLTGGRVADWNNNTMWYGGSRALLAEVCEYKNHFQHFRANYAVFTNAEHDHPDYFVNKEAVVNAFTHFINTITEPKVLITCIDDEGVRNAMANISEDLEIITYGESLINPADGAQHLDSTHLSVFLSSYCIAHNTEKHATQQFTIQGLSPLADGLVWELPVPGKALVYNAIAALILVRELSKARLTTTQHVLSNTKDSVDWLRARDALANFRGISRRCELIYRDDNNSILDDYAHHPTAIAMTLEGIRNFYSPKRLIVDFMPHTYTRSAALLKEFSSAFYSADVLLVNAIYASAREMQTYSDSVSKNELAHIDGETFAEAIREKQNNVHYMPDFTQAIQWLTDNLQPGDMFVSMGAGDNFRIAQQLAEILKNKC